MGNDVGDPIIGVNLTPDSVVNVTLISNTFVDLSSISRTIAPPCGMSMTKVGVTSVKVTPFVIKSCLLGMSFG